MISTVLANLGVWGDLLLIVAGVAAVVCGVLLARRGTAGRRVAGVLALVATAAALALTLAPESGATLRGSFCFTDLSGPLLGDAANVALLLPTAFFGAIATRSPLPVLAATTGLSALIELVQGAAAALNRSCDLNDWTANSAGAVAGALAAWAVLLVVRRDDAAPRAAGDTAVARQR